MNLLSMKSHARPLLGVLVGSLFLAAYHYGSAPALPAWQAGQANIVRVSEKISILPNPRAGNIGLQLGEDGLLMIDDQFFDDVKNTEAAIRELKGDAPLYLVNTHWHGDHTGANRHFGKSATILAHKNVRRRLADDASLAGNRAKDTPRVALPEVTYEDGLSLHFNGEEIRLIHLPKAHTDGDTVVWFQGSNVVHMGDLFFASGYPFIDVDSGGNALGYLAALKSVLEWIPKDAQVIPGHGALTDVTALRAYTQMLETILGRVQALVGEGFSLQEVQDAGISEEFDAAWGGGFIGPARLAESMYRSLKE